MPPETQPVTAAKSVPDYDDSITWNPLDENGEPYFATSIDWSKVKVDEKTGQFKEADLETVVQELNALQE